MKNTRQLVATALFAALSAGALVGHAQTIRIANQGDALSMDPHSLNESLQLSTTSNVYEPLVGRNKDLSLAPALATAWKQTAPTVWRFELRKGVQFHDGTPFTADHVVFAAGTYGTNKLLLDMQQNGNLPGLSPRLGKVVRTNSEAVLAATATDLKVGLFTSTQDF